jgi:Xaa-Pro aminopeptidase
VGDNADAPSTYDFALGGAGMTPMLPMGANGTVLREGQTMMVDGGGCFGPYMTDMSRVFALGTLPSEVVAAHELSLEIHHRFLSEAQVGMSCADLYNQALETVRAAGFAPYFMGHRQQAAFIGHGVGLQINEMPVLHGRSKDLLQPGQVIALEPKFVFPGVGAVGVENTYVVTEQGIECVTAAAPEQIIYL